MKNLSTIIDNQTLVSEEQLGFGSQYLVKHQTHIRDSEVCESIARMSVAEVIS